MRRIKTSGCHNCGKFGCRDASKKLKLNKMPYPRIDETKVILEHEICYCKWIKTCACWCRKLCPPKLRRYYNN